MTDDGKLKWFDSYSDHPTHGKPDEERYEHDRDWAQQKVLDLFNDDGFTPGACVILSGMLEGMGRLELERMVARRESKMREYAEKQMRGEMRAQASVAANVFVERLKEEEEAQENAIEQQLAVVQEKQNEVDGARDDLVAANQALKALEKRMGSRSARL